MDDLINNDSRSLFSLGFHYMIDQKFRRCYVDAAFPLMMELKDHHNIYTLMEKIKNILRYYKWIKLPSCYLPIELTDLSLLNALTKRRKKEVRELIAVFNSNNLIMLPTMMTDIETFPSHFKYDITFSQKDINLMRDTYYAYHILFCLWGRKRIKEFPLLMLNDF